MNNNRCFIKRDNKTTFYLQHLILSNRVVLQDEDEGYFDEEYWFFESEESFHCEVKGDEVIIQDQRLPVFTLPLRFVELEFDNDSGES